MAANPVKAPPKMDAKIVITIDCLSVRPNSQPKNPVAKQDVFIVPDAQRKNMLSSWCHGTGALSSGSFRMMASDSMPNFASRLDSKARSFAKIPRSDLAVVLPRSPLEREEPVVRSPTFSADILAAHKAVFWETKTIEVYNATSAQRGKNSREKISIAVDAALKSLPHEPVIGYRRALAGEELLHFV